MEHILEIWSLAVILLCAFLIGWAAEASQTFMPRALALTLLAWLQTLPEFAVEASIAWNQQRDLMIANLTGSLRLLMGLGWPMIFFVHYFAQKMRKKGKVKEIRLDDEDFLSVIFLFISILYFAVILFKGALTIWDSAVLIAIYAVYLILSTRLPVHDHEEESDLPWVARKVVGLAPTPKVIAVVFLFAIGGFGLYISVHPFVETLGRWALAMGISTFVFVQWVAPFLSEFPEKVTAFNWARQENKAQMGVMNMVGSNINQWTMLAAMVPIVFGLSLGHAEAITFDHLHWIELALTIAQSFLGGLLLLDLKFSFMDALIIFVLWLVQFIYAPLREEVLVLYLAWSAIEIVKHVYHYTSTKQPPRAFAVMREFRWRAQTG